MRRQYSQAETTAPEQEGSAQGLDPFCLPARSWITVHPSSRLECGGELYLDQKRVRLKGRLKSGLPITLQAPIPSFEHVALLRDTDQDAGYTLWLVHRDPSLSLRLGSSSKRDEGERVLKAWSRMLSLSSISYGKDGQDTILDRWLGPVLVKPQQPRRRHSYFAARRPRFLTRRKIGEPGVFPVYQEREIIART